MPPFPTRRPTDGDDTSPISSTATRRDFLSAAGAGVGAAALGGLPGTTAAAVDEGVPTPRLHTDGKWIRDPEGNPVKLRGFATASLDFIAYDWYPWTVREILEMATNRDDGWHPNHVRLPCEVEGIREYGGVEPFVEEVLRPAVDYLRARNVYAMIDFHLIRPYTQQATEDYNADQDSEADQLDPIDDVMTEFWSVVAPEFADDEHVLYEIFNEPTYPNTWSEYGEATGSRENSWLTWREAAQPWVDMVRDHAPETPIVIGSPDWTSETQFAPEHPFDGENLIYAAHIYPDNGQPDEFDPEYGAPAEDVPVIVTEFGWDPEGGQVDQGTTSDWGEPFREWAESYDNMGWTAWCFDDSWAPTFFESPADNPSQGADRPWALKDDEEEHGWYIKQWLQDTQGDTWPESPIEDDPAPEPPSNLTVESVGEVAATVTWGPAADPGEAGVTHYELTVDGEDHGIVLPGEELAASLDGLEPDSTYEVSVVAVDDLDNASEPATVTVETIPYGSAQSPYDGPNEVPGTIQAEDFDEGGHGIAYYDTSEENGGGAYREEYVDVEENDDGYNVGFVNEGEWLEYSVDVETPGTYDVSVSVANGGNSTYDPALSVHVNRQRAGETQVWPTNGWQSWEEIRVGEIELSAGRQILRFAAESGGWNFDAFHLELVEEHEVTEPPRSPDDQWTNDVTEDAIELAWESVPTATEYDVYLDGAHEATTSSTTYTLTGLDPATEYTVGLRSVNDVGESDLVETTVETAEGGTGGPCEDAPTQEIDGQTVCDLNDDGSYRDVTGDGDLAQDDVVSFFEVQHRSAWKQDAFDFSGNGEVNQFDVVELFDYVLTN